MKKKLLVFLLLPVLALTSCEEEADDNVVTESVTVSLTQEEIPVVTTAAETEKKGFGDYTVTTAGAETPEAETVVIFGTEYPLEGYINQLTVDVSLYGTVTEDDLRNIARVKEQGAFYVTVENCGSRDLSFLAPVINKFTQASFTGLSKESESGENTFSYLWNFGGLEKAYFLDFDPDNGAYDDLISAVLNSDIDRVSVTAEKFRITEALAFSRALGSRCIAYKEQEKNAYDEGGEPYIKSTPTVYAYEAERYLSHDDNKRSLLADNTRFSAYITNPSDEDFCISSVSILDKNGDWLPVKGGSYIELNEIIHPKITYIFELPTEDFDYGLAGNGVYQAVFYGENTEEPVLSASFIIISSEDAGLEALEAQQREIYEKALSYIKQYFSTDAYLTQEYVDTHTADEFISQFTDAFTYDYARSLCEGRYIDDDGKLKAADGARGGNISFRGECFEVISGYNERSISCIAVYADSDYCEPVWLGVYNIHMTFTEDGWRVDNFNISW